MDDKKRLEMANARLLLVIWTLVILCLTLLPIEYIPAVGLRSMDKVIHLLEFFPLGFLLMNFLMKSEFKISVISMVIISLITGAAYGGIGEWLQSFIGRSPETYDFLCDLIGLNMGIFTYTRGIRE